MAAHASQGDWDRIQQALRNEVQRVSALLRSVRDPEVPALGEWNIAEVAMHLSQAWLAVPGLARQDLSRIYEVLPGVADRTGGKALIRDIWELAEVTSLGVSSDPERDLAVLADRIEERAEDFLDYCTGRSASDTRSWMIDGVRVNLAVLTGHLLNETLVHGADIARADRRRWRIPPAHAALVLSGFIIPIIRALDPRALVDEARGAGLHAVYDLRIRGGGAFHFIFDDGALRIEEPSARRVDCHISAEPTAFLTVVWGRRSQWSAIAQGRLLAWGRKPWLGPRLQGLLRNP